MQTGPSGKCPEWESAEVIAFVTISVKVAGVVSFLSMLFIIGGIIVSELYRQNLRNYKCDYI